MKKCSWYQVIFLFGTSEQISIWIDAMHPFQHFLNQQQATLNWEITCTLTTLIKLKQSTNIVANQKKLANAMLRWYTFKNVQSPSLTEIQVDQDKINLLSVKSEKRLRSNYQSLKKPNKLCLSGVPYSTPYIKRWIVIWLWNIFSWFQHLMFVFFLHNSYKETV